MKQSLVNLSRPFSLSLALAAACATTNNKPAQPPAEPPAVAVETAVEPAPEPPADTLEVLTEFAQTFGWNLGSPNKPHVLPDGSAVLFLRSSARSTAQSLWQYTLSDRTEKELVSIKMLLGTDDVEYSDREAERRERSRVALTGISSYELSTDGKSIVVSAGGRLYLVVRASATVNEVKGLAGRAIDPRLSPDGKMIGAVVEGDVHVVDIARGKATQLTKRSGDNITFGLPEFVAHEEFGRSRGFWWSPDSRSILVQRTDIGGVETAHLVDPVNPQRPPEARPYPRAGTANAKISLALHSVRGGQGRAVTWDETHPYLLEVLWQDGAPLTLVTSNRRQNEWHVSTVPRAGGAAKTLFSERDDAYVEVRHRRKFMAWQKNELLWLSEARGTTGVQARSLTGDVAWRSPADLAVDSLSHVVADSDTVLVRASRTPTERHVWELTKGGGARRLTNDAGVHRVVASRDGRTLVISSRTLAGDSKMAVWRDSEPAGVIRSLAAEPPFLPNVSLVTVETEIGSLHTAVVKPRKATDARLPVILFVYGGPGDQMVRADRRSYLMSQIIADFGFAVVSIDGRGTPGRTRDWERAIAGDFGAIPLADQVAGLQALFAEDEQLDGSRVGVFGWSYGGYMAALATMRRPDVFSAGFAGAPVADWADYDTVYTERYLGLPAENPEAYERSSLLTYVNELERPLMIVHGTRDDNVYLMHSLKLADALHRANKRFEFVPLVGATHMPRGPGRRLALIRTLTSFFRRHLAP